MNFINIRERRSQQQQFDSDQVSAAGTKPTNLEVQQDKPKQVDVEPQKLVLP